MYAVVGVVQTPHVVMLVVSKKYVLVLLVPKGYAVAGIVRTPHTLIRHLKELCPGAHHPEGICHSRYCPDTSCPDTLGPEGICHGRCHLDATCCDICHLEEICPDTLFS